MYWLELVGSAIGGLLGLAVAALIAFAGFSMATNRNGKSEQLANDYRGTLETDRRRGLGWLHVNSGMSGDPRSYRLAGWAIFVIASLVLLGGTIGLIAHAVASLQAH